MIDKQIIADTIVTAIEGGIASWCRGFTLVQSEHTPTTSPWYSDPELYSKDFIINILTDEGETIEFTRQKLCDGVRLMEQDSPYSYHEMIEENGDADTADVLMQLSLFSELRYG